MMQWGLVLGCLGVLSGSWVCLLTRNVRQMILGGWACCLGLAAVLLGYGLEYLAFGVALSSSIMTGIFIMGAHFFSASESEIKRPNILGAALLVFSFFGIFFHRLLFRLPEINTLAEGVHFEELALRGVSTHSLIWAVVGVGLFVSGVGFGVISRPGTSVR